MPSEEEAIIIEIVKCLEHAVPLDGRQQLSPAGVLDWYTVVAMVVARRLLLVITIGARAQGDEWSGRHFKNWSYQPPEGFDSPKQATVAQLATLRGEQRLLVGWRFGHDLAALPLGVNPVLEIDFSTDPVVRAFFQYLGKAGGTGKEAADFLMGKPELPLPITLVCAIFTGNQVNLRYWQMEERDVVRDAYFIATIRRLLAGETRGRRSSEER